jgi:Arc/MetJ-type ribon-helix-helix transcriptional regulator
MSLNRLFEMKERGLSSPQEVISLRIPVDQLAYVDELAGELELTRSDVIRECLRDGLERTWSDWQTALRSAKTGGKPLPKKGASK